MNFQIKKQDDQTKKTQTLQSNTLKRKILKEKLKGPIGFYCGRLLSNKILAADCTN